MAFLKSKSIAGNVAIEEVTFSGSGGRLITQRDPVVAYAVKMAGEDLRKRGLMGLKEQVDREVAEQFLEMQRRSKARHLDPA